MKARSLPIANLTSEDMEQDGDAVEVLTEMNASLDKILEGKLAAIVVAETDAEADKPAPVKVEEPVQIVEQAAASAVVSIRLGSRVGFPRRRPS